MQRRQPFWRRALAATLLLGAAGMPAVAQELPAAATGSRFKVLVPTLEKISPDVKGNFGKDVSEALRKLIDRMPRHESVQKKEMETSLKKFGLKDPLTCIQTRQLGVQIESELVMCGAFGGTNGNYMIDSLQFVSTKTQEAFQVQAVTAANAQEAAQKIFAQFETYIETLNSLVYCYDYLSSQNWQSALDNCNAALKINPNSQRGLSGKAFALMQLAGPAETADKAKLTEALQLYRKVLELNAVDQEALRTAGVVAARLGQNEESRNYFKQYLELNPGDVGVRLQIANEQNKAGDSEGALRVVEEGLKTDTANVDLLTWAGVFAAQAAFKINQEKKTADGKFAPEAKSMLETGYNYYKKLFDLKNGDIEPQLIPQMMTALGLLERYPEAVELGRRLAADPKTGTAPILVAYSSALKETGNAAEALAILDRAIAMNDTATASQKLRYKKADWLIRAGNLDGARAAFKDAVAAGEVPGDDASNLIWAIGYGEQFQKGNHSEFLKYIEAAREFAETPVEKSKLDYFEGVTLLTIHRPKDAPTTAGPARNLRPRMVQALQLMERGGPYAQEANINIRDAIDNQRKYVEYLDQLIKRGG